MLKNLFLLFISVVNIITPMTVRAAESEYSSAQLKYPYGSERHFDGNLWYVNNSTGWAVCEGPFDTLSGAGISVKQYSGDIIVPEETTLVLGGKEQKIKVVAITSNFYRGASEITSITLPNSIKDIPTKTFLNCVHLEKIVLGNSTGSIGESAFSGCEKLRCLGYDGNIQIGAISLPNTIKTVKAYAFSRCKSIVDALLPNSITTVESGVFMECSGLEKLVFADGFKCSDIPAQFCMNCVSLKKITYSHAITSIGKNAFSGCQNLYLGSALVLPETLTSLGASAFRNTGINELNLSRCKLTSISDYAFAECQNLINVTWRGSITQIGTEAFKDCSLLGSANEIFDLPANLECIQGSAFENCEALRSVNFHGTKLKQIGKSAFRKCILLSSPKFKEGLELIDEKAFYCCASITSIHLPSTVKEVRKEAFRYCEKLTEGSCYNKVTTLINNETFDSPDDNLMIGNYNFMNTPLTVFDVLERNTPVNTMSRSGVTVGVYIGDGVFQNCKLSRMPDYIVSMGKSAFDGCDLLTWAYIPKGSRAVQEGQFRGAKKLSNIEIPNSVMSIGKNAFSGCTSLADINLPVGLTYVGEYAFSRCPIKNLILPDSIKTVGASAFSDDLLETLSIGNGEWDNDSEPDERVLTIGKYNFKFARVLKHIYSYFHVPPILEDPQGTFSNSWKTAVLYVPAGTRQKYIEAEGWKNFVNIEEYDNATVGVEDILEDISEIAINDDVIQSSSPGVQVNIYSISGALIYSGYGSASISDLPSGVYIIKVGAEAKKVHLLR